MEIGEGSGSTGYQLYLLLALDDAVLAYRETHDAVSRHPHMAEEAVSPELWLLNTMLEQRRATALILASCCVEALANLYLAHKTTPEQFATLEWGKFIEKWTVLPSLFVPDYSFPKDGELFQDLKRLSSRRNALVHLKEEVSRGSTVQHPGSLPETASDEHVFIERCRSLPGRPLEHLASFDKTEAITLMKMVVASAPAIKQIRRIA